jgi:hypothetical protein
VHLVDGGVVGGVRAGLRPALADAQEPGRDHGAQRLLVDLRHAGEVGVKLQQDTAAVEEQLLEGVGGPDRGEVAGAQDERDAPGAPPPEVPGLAGADVVEPDALLHDDRAGEAGEDA